MAELVMDNPFSSNFVAQYGKTVSDLKECVQKLKEEFAETKIPVNDDNLDLHRFCAKLEYLLQAGLKVRTGLLGGKKDYWNYFCECLGSNKSLNDGIRFVKSISTLKTNLGRGRAFIRFALVQQRLADTLQQCIIETKVTSAWYELKSVWLNDAVASDIIANMYELNDLKFDLSSHGYDLDASWPSFAKKPYGMLSVHPPSRSTSIGSLNSIPPSQTSYIEPDLQSQVDELEHDKIAAENKSQILEKQMLSIEAEKTNVEEENKHLKSKVMELEVNSTDILKKSDGYDVLCEKLANELKMKEDLFEEKEQLLKSSLEDSQRTIARLEENLSQAANLATTSSNQKKTSSMDLLELKGKVQVAETNNKTLRIDLHSTTKELEARNKVDTAKGKLIDMQDKKLQEQKAAMQKLQCQVEDMLGSKTADVEKYVKVSDELNSVKADLLDREKAYSSLLSHNKELKEMLHSIERKSCDMGKMAKEKLVKYSEENVKLKAKVEEQEKLTHEGDLKTNDRITELEHQITVVTAEKEELAKKVEHIQTNIAGKNQIIQANEQILSNKDHEISNLKTVLESLKSDTGTKESELSNTLLKIQSDNANILEELSGWREKSESLEKIIETKSSEWNREKSALLDEIQSKSLELEVINAALKDKISVLEKCEMEMESEKRVLVEQLESQTGEIELLKEELTGLGKLLGQASVEEVGGDPSQTLLSQVNSVIERNTILESSVHSMEARNSELCKNMKENNAMLENAHIDIDEIKLERKNIGAKLQSTEVTLEDVQMQLKEKTTQLEQLVIEQNEFEARIKELEDHTKDGVSVIEEMKLESETKDRLILSKEQQFLSVNEKVKLMEKLINQLETDNAELTDSSKATELDLQSKEVCLNEMTLSLENKETAVKELETKLQESIYKYQELKNELDEKHVDIHQKETEQMQMLANSSKLENQLRSNETEKQLWNEKMQSLENNLMEKERLVIELNSGLDSKNKEIETLKLESFNNNQHLSDSLQSSENSNSENKTEIASLKEVKLKLSSKIDKLEQDCDTYLQDIQHFEKENETLSESVKKIESEKASMESDRDNLNSEVKCLKKNLEDSHVLQHELITQAETTSANLIEKESIITELNVKIDHISKDISDKNKTLDELRCEKESLLVQAEELEKEKVSLSETMNASYFELKEKLGQFECENERLREEIQCVILEKEKLFAKYRDENSDLQTNIESITENMNSSSTLNLELETKLKSQENEIEAFQISMNEKDNYIEQVNNEKSNLTIEAQKLQQQLKDEDSQNKLLITQLKLSLEQKEQEVTMLQSTHEQELKGLQFQLSTEEMQHQNSLQEYQEKECDVQSMTEKISDLECQVEDLQRKIQQQTSEHQDLVKKHRNQVDDLEEKLMHKDNECQLMAEKLVQDSHVLERERTGIEKLQRERKQSDSQLEGMQSTLSNAEAENIELKKKLIQLIRDKDTLWKKSDKLQVKQKMIKSQISGVWADSSDITKCTQCDTQFGFTVRKHHCRLCGQVFCYYCCNNWVMTSFSNKQERVCGECLMHQSHLESASEGEDTDSEEHTVEQSVELPYLRSPKWKQLLNNQQDDTVVPAIIDEVSVEHDPPSEFLVQNEEENQIENNQRRIQRQLLADDEFTVEIDDEKLLNMTDERKSGRLQNVVPDSSKESSASPSDDGYDLITKDEVVQSSNTPVPDPDTQMADILTSNDFDEEGAVEGPPELWIKAGKAYATAVNIEKKGATLTWEFTTYPKDINFSLRYRDSEWTSFEESETLIPVCKCNSHKKAVSGELIARKPGIYTLVFDNKTSRFTSKKLNYNLKLKFDTEIHEESS